MVFRYPSLENLIKILSIKIFPGTYISPRQKISTFLYLAQHPNSTESLNNVGTPHQSVGALAKSNGASYTPS